MLLILIQPHVFYKLYCPYYSIHCTKELWLAGCGGIMARICSEIFNLITETRLGMFSPW